VAEDQKAACAQIDNTRFSIMSIQFLNDLLLNLNIILIQLVLISFHEFGNLL
jgi:hypothetical protein